MGIKFLIKTDDQFIELRKASNYRNFLEIYLELFDYSLSDFARATGFGRGFPGDVISGKRRLTSKSSYAFEKALKLPLKGKKYFRLLVANEEVDLFPEIDRARIGDEILNLKNLPWKKTRTEIQESSVAGIQTLGFDKKMLTVLAAAGDLVTGSSIKEIKERTGFSNSEILKYSEHLEKLGLLEIKDSTRVIPKDLHLFLETADQSSLLKQTFHQSVDLAEKSIVKLDKEKNDFFFNSSFCIQKNKLPMLKQELRETILKFVDRNTTCVEGVGDVCTLSTFQHLKTSGSPSLESFEQPLPLEGSLVHPSKKMEQSLVSFSAAYPTWQPPQEAHQFLSKVAAVEEENEMIQENIINNNNNSNLRGNGGVGGGGTSRFSDFRKLRYSDFLNPRYPHSVHRYLHRHYMHHNHNNRVDGTTVEATAAFTRRYPAGIDQGGGNEGGSGSGAGGSATSVFSFGDALNSVMLHSHGTTYHMNASIHTGGGGGGVLSSSAAGGVRQIPPEEERIVVAHALLESYYEQQEEAIEQQQRLEETQHAQQDAAAGNSLVREQDHARGRPSEPQSIPNNDAPSPLPPSLLLPQQINTTRRVPSSVSPYTSPKTGRSLREMSSELSVLSREHSEKDKETGK